MNRKRAKRSVVCVEPLEVRYLLAAAMPVDVDSAPVASAGASVEIPPIANGVDHQSSGVPAGTPLQAIPQIAVWRSEAGPPFETARLQIDDPTIGIRVSPLPPAPAPGIAAGDIRFSVTELEAVHGEPRMQGDLLRAQDEAEEPLAENAGNGFHVVCFLEDPPSSLERTLFEEALAHRDEARLNSKLELAAGLVFHDGTLRQATSNVDDLRIDRRMVDMRDRIPGAEAVRLKIASEALSAIEYNSAAYAGIDRDGWQQSPVLLAVNGRDLPAIANNFELPWQKLEQVTVSLDRYSGAQPAGVPYDAGASRRTIPADTGDGTAGASSADSSNPADAPSATDAADVATAPLADGMGGVNNYLAMDWQGMASRLERFASDLEELGAMAISRGHEPSQTTMLWVSLAAVATLALEWTRRRNRGWIADCDAHGVLNNRSSARLQAGWGKAGWGKPERGA